MKLHIAYRIYPKVSKPTIVYEHDKLLLAQACLRSFVASLGQVKPAIHFILDGCPEDYEKMVLREVPSGWLTTIEKTNGIGNKATFGRQLDVLSRAKNSIVMFAEDDYIYKPLAMERFLNDLERIDWDYATPYRHPDLRNMHGWAAYFKGLKHVDNASFRKIPSTCMTFLCMSNSLALLSPLREYTKGRCDADMWLGITASTWQILSTWIWAIRHKNLQFKYIAQGAFKMKLRHPRRLCLIEPEYNVATHAEKKFLSDGERWIEYSVL